MDRPTAHLVSMAQAQQQLAVVDAGMRGQAPLPVQQPGRQGAPAQGQGRQPRLVQGLQQALGLLCQQLQPVLHGSLWQHVLSAMLAAQHCAYSLHNLQRALPWRGHTADRDLQLAQELAQGQGLPGQQSGR